MGKAKFAPVPSRAIGDQRLGGSHFRVLAAIAIHDRMSASRRAGQGCWASHKTLSEECGINYSNFSTVVRELGLWGYIVAAPHPINKRTRVYRVIYGSEDIEDSLPPGKQSDDETTADSLPIGKASDQRDDAEAKPAGSANDTLPTDERSAEIVCPPIQQATENTQQPDDMYITLNVNRFCETERYSPEGAPMVIGDPLGSKKADENDGAFLAIIERELRTGQVTLDRATEQQVDRIMEEHDDGDALFHQAERILSTWGRLP